MDLQTQKVSFFAFVKLILLGMNHLEKQNCISYIFIKLNFIIGKHSGMDANVFWK